MIKCKSIVWREQTDGSVKPFLEDIYVDDEPRAGEVFVKVISSGLCHTDMTYAMFKAYGPSAMFGHEGCGIVQKVGAGVKSVKPGDKVVMSLQLSCGQCKSCMKGLTSHCEKYTIDAHMLHEDGTSPYMDMDGKPIMGGFGTSFTQYMTTLESSVVKIDDEAPDYAGVFSCGIQTGAGSVLHEFNPDPGDSIVVIGAGMVGLASIMAAKMRGMYPIIAVGSPRSPIKLEAAKKYGATHVIVNNPGTDLMAEILKIVPGGVDFCLDTAGGTEIAPVAINCTNPKYGKTLLIGTSDLGAKMTLNCMDLMTGRFVGSTVIGKTNPHLFVPQLIRMWRDGHLPIEDCLSFYELEDMEAAFDAFNSGKAIKVVINMPKE